VHIRCWFLLVVLLPCLTACAAGLSAGGQKVTVDGATFTVKVVRASLRDYQVKVGLAQGRVGGTQSLADIARREGALAAINGSFFNAYTKSAIKPPYHHLITGGEVVHLANNGTTLGFDADGNYRMDKVCLKLQGNTGGSAWYAYLMNHPPGTAGAATLYTRYWIGERTPAQGRQVLVQDGKVKAVTGGGQAMPDKGYVLLFSGGEEYLAGRFRAGAPCSFQLEIEAEDVAFWSKLPMNHFGSPMSMKTSYFHRRYRRRWAAVRGW